MLITGSLPPKGTTLPHSFLPPPPILSPKKPASAACSPYAPIRPVCPQLEIAIATIPLLSANFIPASAAFFIATIPIPPEPSTLIRLLLFCSIIGSARGSIIPFLASPM